MQFDSVMRVELIKTNASDADVARAAWVSNFGEDARTKDAAKIKGLINFLYRNKHMSPFEHGSFTFFVDVPFFVRSEFMRHRTFSYNEVSARYTDMKPKFYLPPKHRPTVQKGKVGAYTFEVDEIHHDIIKEEDTFAYRAGWEAYDWKKASGIANEVARNSLSVGMYTQFYATCNPRNLMQFTTLRNDKHALFEIRDVAEQMEEYLEEAMPLTFAAYREGRDWDEVFAMLRERFTLDELREIADAKTPV